MRRALLKEQEVAAFQTTEEIIDSRGFKCETHKVETKDGYILTIHRIVIPNVDYKEVKPRPVLLQHGFGGCSTHWVMGSSDGHIDFNNNNLIGDNKDGIVSNSLAFTLSSAGYDVWLGNFRGTRYSQKHKSLDVSDSEFWDFCCDEMIEHDLPATIDYILDTTKRDKMGYVGFSAGATTMFGLLSTQPRYNQKIKPFVAVAPVCNVSPMRGLVPYMVISHTYLPLATKILLRMRMTNPNITRPLLTGPVIGHYMQRLSLYLLDKAQGLNWDRVDEKSVGPFLAHAGDTSRKQFVHFSQFQGGLKRFDYGKKGNLLEYNQEVPPKYELENITNESICIIYGKNDYIATEENVHYITSLLNAHDVYRVPDKHWGHLDFHISKDVGTLVNRKVLSLLKTFHD